VAAYAEEGVSGTCRWWVRLMSDLLVPKNTNNHPDGFSLGGTILTS
jgi:hypothetical protein